MNSLLLKRWRLIIGEVSSFNPSIQSTPKSNCDLDSKLSPESNADPNTQSTDTSQLEPNDSHILRDMEKNESPSSDSALWTSDDQHLDKVLTQLYPKPSSLLRSSKSSLLDDHLSSHLSSHFESPSSLSLSDLLNQTRILFAPSVVHIIQHDLIDQFGIQALLDDPQTLQNLDPDLPLVINLLQSQPLLTEKQKAGIRVLINRTLSTLLESLKVQYLPQLRGQLDRRFKTKRPHLKDLDWSKSIRKNLHLYSPDTQALILAKRIGYRRKRKGAHLDTLILCVDQSGSMASSVIYATLFASILSQIPSIRLHLLLFDTQVYQVEDQLLDPIDLIMNLKFDGGTQIHKALHACESLCLRPQDTHLILISDLYENGSSDLFLNAAHHLIQKGVNLLTLLALNNEGTPSYHRSNAQYLAKRGSPTFTATPDQFPLICSLALNRIPLSQWPTELTLNQSN